MQANNKGLVAFNRSIRARLVIGTFVILLALIGILTTLIARNASLLLKEQTENQLTLLVSQSARSFGDFLQARRATIYLWASDSLLLSVVRDPALSAVFLPSLTSYLGRYTTQEPWISNIFLINNGEIQFSLRGPHDSITFDTTVLLNEELNADKVRAFSINEIDGRQQLLMLRQAVDRGNPLEGIYVAMQLDLDIIHQHLFSDVRPSETGFLTVINKNGSLAVSNTPDTLLRILPETRGTGELNVSADLPQSKFLIREANLVDTQLRLLGAAATSDIEKPVRQMVYIAAGFGIFAIVLGILSTIYFANRVTAPLRQLSNDARDLANFGFDAQGGRPGTPGSDGAALSSGYSESGNYYGADEVGELAAIFDLLNRTTAELTDANLLLERRNLDLNAARSSLAENLSRLERELNSARQLQIGMVPSTDGASTHGLPVDIDALMEPAREVGGDFYDFFLMGDHSLCFVIGDVSDKGTPSALFMARAISLIRFAVEKMWQVTDRKWEPAEVMENVNAHLCRYNASRMFVTLFVGLLNTKTGTVVYTNCGHVSPIVISNAGGNFLSEVNPDLPLGVLKTARYRNFTYRLTPGDYLFLYTDGVTEAENPSRLFFGRDNLIATVQSQKPDSSRSIIHAVRKAVDQFSSGAEPFDDITMLVLGWQPIEQDQKRIDTANPIQRML